MAMKRIGLFANSTKPEAIHWAEKTARMLFSIDVESCVEPDVLAQFSPDIAQRLHSLKLEEFENFADIVISFGGDGTMLKAARSFVESDIPIMGVNLGTLGFLAEFTVDEIENALSAIMIGEYLIEDRAIIESDINGKTVYAFNDFVVHNRVLARLIEVQAFIDGELIADYRADGLIVSTPTGSTAYSLSSGGPIMAPNAKVLCLTPVSPHSLTLRPLVVPDNYEIAIQPITEAANVLITADGQEAQPLTDHLRFVIRRSDKVIKLIKRSDHSYFELLKRKLLWSVNAAGQRDTDFDGDA